MNWLKRYVVTYFVKYVLDYIKKHGKEVSMKKALIRAGRVLVAILVSGTAAQYGDNVLYISLTPAISGFGKWLREKKGWSWLPF